MRNLLNIFIFSLFFSSLTISAQIETITETINGTDLTITMDKRIKNTINTLEESCGKTSPLNKSGINNNTPTSTKGTNIASNKKLSNADICKQNPRILGYKIQIAVVKNKEKADKIGVEFRNKFPNIKVEIDASLRPNYKILAGSYFTKESATPDLRRIRGAFSSAISIQYRIFCADAK